jgi:hypothetical protein
MTAREPRTLVINVNLTRQAVTLLILAALAAALTAYLAWNHGQAAAAEPQTPLRAVGSMRMFYLTQATVTAGNALDACADGYHMASLWEILDPSNLQYDTVLGYTAADSGEGPPVWAAFGDYGWIRTGNYSSPDNTAGLANCSTWTSSSAAQYGSTAALPWNWTAGISEVHVWDVPTWPCSVGLRVWCVED